VVIVDSMIAATGCVTNIRVVRSVQPAMDYAALRAVSGWRFQPPELGDRAVAVYITITVNFTLR
jgi:TonB family protein